MGSHTGTHIDTIMAAAERGDFTEAIRRDGVLRGALLMGGIKSALDTEPLTDEQREYLRTMQLAVLDAFVAERARR